MPLSKASYRVKPILDATAMTVLFQVIDRESEKAVETLTLDAKELPDTIRPDIALYGLSKLCMDRTSEVNFSDDKTTPKSKLAAVQEIFDMLKGGVWERERKAGAPLISAEIEALAELRKVSVSEMQNALRKYTKEQREQIFANAAVVSKVAEIKAKRAVAEDLDLNDLIPEADLGTE